MRHFKRSRLLVASVAYSVGLAVAAVAPTDSRLASAQDGPTFLSLQSVNLPEYFIRHRDGVAEISKVTNELDRKDATFRLVPGLADRDRVSFESVNLAAFYLRHQDGQVKLQKAEGGELFRKDATFKQVKGLSEANSSSFEAVNLPDHFLRHKDGKLWLEKADGTELFAKDATFRVAPPHYNP